MATTTQIEQVRRGIGDSKKAEADRFVSDGFERLYSLAYKNVFDVKVYINSTLLDSAAYTVLGEVGKISFVEAQAVNDDILISYSYAGYTDEKIGELVDAFSVEGAIIEALKELLADSARFYDYSQGQTTDRRSQIFDHLKDLLALAKEDLRASTVSDVAIGNRHTGLAGGRGVLDLSRDDTFSEPVDGYSSNNV